METKLGFAEIQTSSAGLDKGEAFHVVKEIVGFLLFIHQQIPAVLKDLEDEFNNLKEESKSLQESAIHPTVSKASTLRMHNMRIREVKRCIKKRDKLMSSISGLLSSISLLLDEMPRLQDLALILGPSVMRPQRAYEVLISNRADNSERTGDRSKCKRKEALSRKVIRELISTRACDDSVKGPTKLFLLVKAPPTLSLPMHFLPKRDFRYSKKITPFRIHIKCRQDKVANDVHNMDSSSTDFIWFQCKHAVKGLAVTNMSLG